MKINEVDGFRTGRRIEWTGDHRPEIGEEISQGPIVGKVLYIDNFDHGYVIYVDDSNQPVQTTL